MKRLQTFLFLFLFAFAGFGQNVLTYGGKVLRGYDANQPLNIDDECKVWLDGKDASTFTLDGTSVDNWAGKGSLGINAANGNADATRPTYDASTGRVTFIAANSTFLQSAAFGAPLTQPFIIFFVYKITGNIADNEMPFGGVTQDVRFWFVASNFYIYANPQITGGVTDANDNIHVGLFNGASSEYWINGVLGVTGNAGTNALGGITLGASFLLANFADVDIMEVIVFNADISDVDRDIITGYLANKWDITATTTHKGYVLTTE